MRVSMPPLQFITFSAISFGPPIIDGRLQLIVDPRCYPTYDIKQGDVMDPLIISIVTGICANLTTDGLKKIVSFISNDSVFMSRLKTMDKSEVKSAIEEILQSILLKANNGEIQLDGASLISLNSIVTNHVDGRITIERTNIHGKSISVGGTAGNGTTEIRGGSNLSTNGTMISVGDGCSIRIRGNATIKQS